MSALPASPTPLDSTARVLLCVPVLDRADGAVQVGDDPLTAVVVDADLGRRLRTWADGSRTVGDIHEELRLSGAAGVSRASVDRLLELLSARGLLRDVPTQPDPQLAEAAVRVIGTGRLGQQVARLLIASGVGTVFACADPQGAPGVPRRRGRARPVPLNRSRSQHAQQFRAVVDPRGRADVQVFDHWSKPEGQRVDLTVLATGCAEPDRVIAAHLGRAGQPHLPIRFGSASATVGPLVVPGRTSCLHCTDLTRTARDPHWPTLLSQLSRFRPLPPPVVASWAATCGAAQVLSALLGEVPDSVGATLEIRWPTLGIEARPWAMDPACGCGWLARSEWGA